MSFVGLGFKKNSDDIYNLIYPIGSVYCTTSDSATCPVAVTGTTWVKIEGGRVLVAAGGDFSVTSTGGSSTHNHQWYIANVSEGKNSEQLEHTSDSSIDGASYNSSGVAKELNNGNFQSEDLYTNNASSYPPYYVVNMWRRTA
jgi:hypothetical protein